MRDFTITMTHRPGELERITDALSKAGVNIKALAALTVGHQAVLRLIADDVAAARDALQQGNIRFEEEEVFTLLMENRPGEIGMMAHKLAEAGINLHAVYLTGVETDLIEVAVAVDNIKKAKQILNA